jgi:SAM-dependent methyltransferase
VLSVFDSMFAPRHDVTAQEMARVLKPGGWLRIVAWTPEGWVGDFFRLLGAHLPPLPPFASAPVLWGDPGYARSLFTGTDVELEFERDAIDFRFVSALEAVEHYETNFGPVIVTREHLEADGLWTPVREDLLALYERHANGDGSVSFPAEYLVILGRKTESHLSV